MAEKTLEQIITDFAYANQDGFYTDEVNAELKHHGYDPISADDVQAILNGAPMQPAAEAVFAAAVVSYLQSHSVKNLKEACYRYGLTLEEVVYNVLREAGVLEEFEELNKAGILRQPSN